MSEEMTVAETPEADQGDMMSSWMDDAVVVDGETGEPIPTETQTLEGEANEGKPVGDSSPNSDETTADEMEQPQKKEENQQGFGSRFYVTDEETGENKFDSRSAVEFLLPGEGKKIFSHPGRQFVDPKPDASPTKAPWETAFEEHQNKVKELSESKLTWRNHIQEGLRLYENDWIKASQYADQKVSEEIEDAKTKLDWEMRENDYRGFQTQKEKDALQARASANEAAIMGKFKDHKEYAELVYNFGGPIINRLYDLMNPGLASQQMTKEEASEGINDFWRNIMADKDQGQFIVDLILSAWSRENLPSMIGTIAEKTEAKTRNNIRGAVRGPTGLTPNPKVTNSPAESKDPATKVWTDYLGRNPFESGGVPEV